MKLVAQLSSISAWYCSNVSASKKPVGASKILVGAIKIPVGGVKP